MKKQFWVILGLAGIFLITVFMLFVYGIWNDRTMWVSRGLAAKMTVFACMGEDGALTVQDQEGNESWYADYIDEAVNRCGMYPEKDGYSGMDSLTYGEVKSIASAFSIDYESPEPDDKKIPADQWFEIYDRILEESSLSLREGDLTQGESSVRKVDLIIVGTSSNMEGLSMWQCVTDQGIFDFTGIALDTYMDAMVSAYVCKDHLIAIREEKKEPAKIKNEWIQDAKGRSVTVDIWGYSRTFNLDRPLEETAAQVMGDIVLTRKKVSQVVLKSTVIKGEILSVGEDYVEIKNYGKVYMTDHFRVLDLTGEDKERSVSDLQVGNKYTEFVVDGKMICGALIRGDSETSMIRVLLSASGYTGYTHENVCLTSSVPFWSVCRDVRTDYEAGTELTIDSKSLPQGQSMVIQTSATSGQIQILSLDRGQGHPAYRGMIEITNMGDGLILVNELLLEEYLYGVVPSEMPASYDIEALKVQAVCARSFAAAAIRSPRFSQWNAHVDDSTATQVYNNSGEDPRATQAVDETAGKVLLWQQTPVEAYFYSTSCGSSSSPGDIWLSGESPEYMEGRLQIIGSKDVDLSSEDAFHSFIDDYEDKDYFEKDISWFRWQVTMNLSDVKTAVDKSLLTRMRTVPDQITVLDSEGNFIQKEISTVGEIREIYVNERAKSGVLKSVIVEGSEAIIKISGEYNIRLLLAPVNAHVICHDGTDAGTMNLLPSGYFYVAAEDSQSCTLKGGGYGHGAGMSQNGVWALACRGYSWQEILKHYFPGTTVGEI